MTAILVLTVILLAAEKHKSTYLAPVGIGLTLLACHLFGVVWTGCGINPARSFGPSVVSGSFPGYHWIYWIGPMIGTFMAVGFYVLLKVCNFALSCTYLLPFTNRSVFDPFQLFDYTSVVFGQDADHEVTEEEVKLKQQISNDKKLGLFEKAKGKVVIFHKRQDSTGKSAPGVEPFNPENEATMGEIRDGNAVVVDLHQAGYQENAMEMGQIGNGGAATGSHSQDGGRPGAARSNTYQQQNQPMFINGVPSMRPEAQDVGGLLAPGTERSAL